MRKNLAREAGLFAHDPFAGFLWNIQTIRMPPRWAEPDAGQKPVIVAVVDSGVDYDHEDLKANMWVIRARDPWATG